jgi:hypothetical protein
VPSQAVDGSATPGKGAAVSEVMDQLGFAIGSAGHDLLVCSPFADSADTAVARGVARASQTTGAPAIEFHYPDMPDIVGALDALRSSLQPCRIDARGYTPIPEEQGGGMRNSWLLVQIAAMERSHAVIAVGGRPEGSASLLLAVAESRRKPVLPLTFLGGAAEQYFARHRYSLEDRLDDDITILAAPKRISECIRLVERLALGAPGQRAASPPRFFLSYARSRPAEADFVEMTLRRRGLPVFRDRHDFGAGKPLQGEIDANIEQADVFVAMWSREYACSPHCFDELTSAARRRAASATSAKPGKPEIWLLCVDETRVVPPEARDLINFVSTSRQSLEANLLELLTRIDESASLPGHRAG